MKTVDDPAQRALLLPIHKDAIDLSLVQRQPNMTKAIDLCVSISGRQDKSLAADLDIDPATWSKIKNGQAAFPHERWIDLFNECGNEVPLYWLADQRGYNLVRKESEVERENRLLREQLLEKQREIDTITSFVSRVKL